MRDVEGASRERPASAVLPARAIPPPEGKDA